MSQIELQKKKSTNLARELSESEDRLVKEQEVHRAEVSALQSQIKHLSREILENEVTIGELREEVQTLEIAVFELRTALAKAETEKEEIKELFEAKLEEKESQLEEAKKILPPIPPPRSLKEEFDDIIVLEGQAGEAVAQEIRTAKGEYRLVKVEEVINVSPSDETDDWSGQTVCLLPEVEWALKEPPSSPPPPPPVGEEPPEINVEHHWNDIGTDMVTTVFAVNELHFDESRFCETPVQYTLQTKCIDTSASIEEEPTLLVTNLPNACDVAQKAVTGASGRNLPKAMDNLSKAYNHSKTCKKCNETLGKFLGRYHSTTWCQVASR
uniref:Myosin-10-like protein isoform x3 n=1 Tax=Triatoma infestans TaxID=30076 RepID=A0A161MQL4_TRIIF